MILVAGALYSGTILLDAIISNDDHGFSCGNVKTYFYPYRPHHYAPEFGCGNPDCTIWSEIKKLKKQNIKARNILIWQTPEEIPHSVVHLPKFTSMAMTKKRSRKYNAFFK